MSAIIDTPPYIPLDAGAPFSKEQISWLNGFLAGAFSGQGNLAVAEPPSGPNTAAKPLTLLWGSQTGNCEGLARLASKRLGTSGFSPKVVDMADFPREQLESAELVVIITSTYGDGEAPDNASALHSWLMSEAAPRLDRLKYCVVALGDSSYPDFCKCGIEFDERLKALGAAPILPRLDCDVEFEEAFEQWLDRFEKAAGGVVAAPVGAESEQSEPQPYGKARPFPATIVRNVSLNGLDSLKDTRHIELRIQGSGMSYRPGDALAVLPENDAGYVAEFLAAAGFSGEEPAAGPDGEVRPLREALRLDYDITSLTLKGLKAYATLIGSGELAALADDREAFAEYAWGRQLVDLLIEHPYAFASPDQLLSMLGKLTPRLYSISSSPKAHPGEVHVTVGVLRYEAHGRRREGVCSGYLARQPAGATVRIYFHPSKFFQLPEEDATPIIMVGPGTGIAPFRAFLEERSAVGSTGENWLFFGDQRLGCDFLYRDELEGFLASGALTRLDTAFSRDQARKIYVQDRMMESSAELYRWLQRGACFYVCGDASRMAKDVDAALRQIVQAEGALSPEEAKAYIDRLKKDKRYLRDVY